MDFNGQGQRDFRQNPGGMQIFISGPNTATDDEWDPKIYEADEAANIAEMVNIAAEMGGNSVPERYHKAQTMERQAILGSLAQQNTPSRINEQGKASCTPVEFLQPGHKIK